MIFFFFLKIACEAQLWLGRPPTQQREWENTHLWSWKNISVGVCKEGGKKEFGSTEKGYFLTSSLKEPKRVTWRQFKGCLLCSSYQYAVLQARWGILEDSSLWSQNLPPTQGMLHLPHFSATTCKSCSHKRASHLQNSSSKLWKPYIINNIRKYWNCRQCLFKKIRRESAVWKHWE